MTDETVHIQPAIPSRAAQQPATPSPFNQPAFIENPSPGTKPSRRGPYGVAPALQKRKAKKKAKALPAAEIKKINAKRKKNLKKPSAIRAKKAQAALHAVRKKAVLPKNPNRPLEMKNQLSAVLSMVGTLQKAELVFFSQAVPAMQALSRSGRRRVIAALQQVYG